MISEKEFKSLLNKNPQLKEKYQRKMQREKRLQTENFSASTQKTNKYFNVKVYEYETGLVAEDKTIYNAGKIVAVYDSHKEYNRWCELKLLQKVGEIQNLSRQVHMIIQEAFLYNEEKIGKIEYVADFIYEKCGKTIVEDVKPLDPKTGKHRFTKDFVLKWKLLKHRYPENLFVIF